VPHGADQRGEVSTQGSDHGLVFCTKIDCEYEENRIPGHRGGDGLWSGMSVGPDWLRHCQQLPRAVTVIRLEERLSSRASGNSNTTAAYHLPMASMGTCACGWTVITPLGPDDVKKHVSIHLRDNHPGTVLTADEMDKLIKTV